MIKFTSKGDFRRLSSFFEKTKNLMHIGDLDKFGRAGVAALQQVTPKDTGLTAASWDYKIERSAGSVRISFHNSNIQNGIPIAILLQYGHATRSGSFVEGRDYINPAIQPIFDQIAEDAWKEVTNK